ncbi:MAG: hypothetical protein R3352_08280 [Salinisphaeraceae bacterium]|nr:hypothetical protein [Salinisphaeraceae bacterium]
MKILIAKIVLLIAMMGGLSSLTACERDEGPAEDIGEELDQMAE